MGNTFSTKKPSLVNNPIFIEGFTRTGKLLLGKIVSSFKGIENFQYVSVIEQILYIHKLGSIRRDAAIALIKCQIDEYAYNMSLGRNINFRYDDATSIYNNLELNKYLKRSLIPYGEELKKEIVNFKSRFLFILHESFLNISLLYKAYPEMTFIHLVRHPIDIIHSWDMNGWGNRFTRDPLSFDLVLEENNDLIPWHVKEWKDEYASITSIDRIIKMIHNLTEYEKHTYSSLPTSIMDLIIEVKYEFLIENTFDTINLLSTFLKTKPHDKFNVVLDREKCPSKISLKMRKKKLDDIKSKASKKYMKLLDEMVINYEEENSVL